MAPYHAWAFIAGGLFVVLVALLRVVQPVDLPPGDMRSEGWFILATTAFIGGFGCFFVVVGVIRLMRGR